MVEVKEWTRMGLEREQTRKWILFFVRCEALEGLKQVVTRPAAVFEKLPVAAVWRLDCKEVSAETGIARSCWGRAGEK